MTSLYNGTLNATFTIFFVELRDLGLAAMDPIPAAVDSMGSQELMAMQIKELQAP